MTINRLLCLTRATDPTGGCLLRLLGRRAPGLVVLDAGDSGVVVLDHLLVLGRAALLGRVEQFLLHERVELGPVRRADAQLLHAGRPGVLAALDDPDALLRGLRIARRRRGLLARLVALGLTRLAGLTLDLCLGGLTRLGQRLRRLSQGARGLLRGALQALLRLLLRLQAFLDLLRRVRK